MPKKKTIAEKAQLLKNYTQSPQFDPQKLLRWLEHEIQETDMLVWKEHCQKIKEWVHRKNNLPARKSFTSLHPEEKLAWLKLCVEPHPGCRVLKIWGERFLQAETNEEVRQALIQKLSALTPKQDPASEKHSPPEKTPALIPVREAEAPKPISNLEIDAGSMNPVIKNPPPLLKLVGLHLACLATFWWMEQPKATQDTSQIICIPEKKILAAASQAEESKNLTIKPVEEVKDEIQIIAEVQNIDDTGASKETDQARPDLKLSLHEAIQAGDLVQVNLCLEKSNDLDEWNQADLSPLHLAAMADNIQILKSLLTRNPKHSSNRKGISPLHLAISAHNNDHALLLLEAGSNPLLLDKDKKTYLHYCAKAGNLITAKTLISRKIPVDNADRFGLTPLMYAAQSGQSMMCEYLIREGANVFATSQNRSPLRLASRMGYLPTVKILLQNGANPAETLSDGLSLAEYIRKHLEQSSQQEILKLLEIKT